jgi:hypothetical protein
LNRSAQAVVLASKSWRVLYRGGLGDGLRRALEDLEAGREVARGGESGKGLEFEFTPARPLSYEKDIAPILSSKCQNCHTQKARYKPFFEDYESVRGWAAMIRETLFSDRMPPYSWDPLYGKIKNDISLSAEEKGMLVRWIDEGARRDGESDPLTEAKNIWPAKRTWVKNHKPIYTAAMEKEADIPPGGTIEYPNYQLGGPVPKELWIDVINVITTNPRQVHHEALMVVPKPLSYYNKVAGVYRDDDMASKNQDGDVPRWTLAAIAEDVRKTNAQFTRIQVWGSGRGHISTMAEGTAVHVPKGYYLILESHYMGTGKPETEKTTLQFFGSTKRGGRKQLRSLSLKQDQLDIPPGEKRYVVETKPIVLPKTIQIHSFLGHLHMRGRAVKLKVTDNGGATRTVASIPNYYYGWQTGASLFFETPLTLPAGSTLKGECEFDNSAQNPNNPDPTKRVRFGQRVDRTEMCYFHIGFTVDEAEK